MAIRPSHKLERSGSHGLVEVERVPDGSINVDIYDVGLVQDDEALTLNLSPDEAAELAAMLRSVLGQPLSTEDAVVLRLDDDAVVHV